MSRAPVTNGPAGDAAKLLRRLQRELSEGAISAERAAEWADALARRAPAPPADPVGGDAAEQSQRLRAQEWFDFAPNPCVSTDLMGVVVEANYAAAELFRTRKEFLPGKPLLLYLCERDRPGYYGLLTHLRQGVGEARGLPARLRLRPNEYADVLLWTSSVVGESGGVIGFRWLFRDVSAVTQAEQALRQERDFADGLLEAAEAVVLVLDAAGRIVRANSYARRVSGRDDRELVGAAWPSLLSEADAPQARRAVCDALDRGATAAFTTTLATPAGRLRLIAWTAKAVAQGVESAGVLVMGQDITDLHEAREQVVQAERLAALGRMMAI
jgi:two-component system, cell cycle sensor histidine kinase and response regulator CckA